MDDDRLDATTATEAEEKEEVLSTDEIRFADFNVKSPLVGGSYDEEDDDSNEEAEGGGDDAAKGAEETAEDTPPGKPYRVYDVDGIQYKFNSEAEIDTLAQKALRMAPQEIRLQNYAQVIDAIEKDNGLANAVMDAIRAYQSGVPLARPEPAQAKADPDVEPEQGDDEDFDDYEKRLNQWREDRMQRMMDQRIQEHLANVQRQTMTARVQQAHQQIITYVMADPDRGEVLDTIQSPNFPDGLRRAMDIDGATFMSVYDTIKRQKGKPAYFNAPPLFDIASERKAPAAQQRVPFAESGKATTQVTGKGGVGDQLPDFKAMSDEEFENWKNKLKFAG